MTSDEQVFHCQRCPRAYGDIAGCNLANCEFRHNQDSPQPSGFARRSWLVFLVVALISTIILAFFDAPFSLPWLVLVPILLLLIIHAITLRRFAERGEWVTIESSGSRSLLRLGMLNGRTVTFTRIDLMEKLHMPYKPAMDIPISKALIVPVNYTRLLELGRPVRHRALPQVDFYHTKAERMVVGALADLASCGYINIYRAKITYSGSFTHLLYRLTFTLLGQPQIWEEYVILAARNREALKLPVEGVLEGRLLEIVQTWKPILRSGPENALPNVFRVTHMLFPEPVDWPTEELIAWAVPGIPRDISQFREQFQAGKAWYGHLLEVQPRFIAQAERQARLALDGRTRDSA